MEEYNYIVLFFIGLSLGSFFNVIIFRFYTGKSALRGRSKCSNCNSVIKWFDLVPVLSYFVLRGKCRECGRKLSPLYPVVEITTAAILLLLFLNTPLISQLTVTNASIVLLLTLIIFIDIRYLVISDKILILLTIVIISSRLMVHNTDFYQLLISAFGLTSFFAILFLASKGKWIGLGDIKLIFLIGILLGYPMSYMAIISAVWLAAIFSIILLVTKKADMKTKIPFGSFLSATTIAFVIFNNELQEIPRYFY